MKIDNHRYRWLLFLAMMLVLISCGTGTTVAVKQKPPAGTTQPDLCIHPLYGDFSYPISKDPQDILIPGFNMFILPSSPWRIESSLPDIDELGNYWEHRSVDVIQARQVDNFSEIWLHVTSGLTKQAYLAVYRTDTKEWLVIPEQIDTLLVDKSGSLWGSHSGFSPDSFDGRVLSRFDDDAKIFIAEKGLEYLASGLEFNGSYYYSQVLIDNQGLFWILVPKDAIYRYNPATQEISRFFDIPGIFSDAKMTLDGTIYVLLYNEVIHLGVLEPGYALNLYNPETGKVGSISLIYNLEPYPRPKNMLIDHKGRIWLDNIAFMDEYGFWHQIQRTPIFISPIREVYSDYRYKRAKITLESSDGRLWFLHQNGMVSLDPEKGEWCWFTTYQSNIVEDADHNLWMIADGKLYKYPLKP